jgi:sensor histidine kinase YesM
MSGDSNCKMMTKPTIHSLIPFSKLFKLLLGFVFILQLAIITYNHLTGFYEVNEPEHFISRLFLGTLLSLIAAFIIAYPDLYIIRFLNKNFPWNRKLLQRIFIQLGLTLLIALVGSTFITSISHLMNPYSGGLSPVLITNGLIFSVCNIIIMIILEARIFFMESSESKRKTENLEKELSQIRFEVLKKQINPPFMFNSLNVLSGLIDKDTDKAQEFIDEFSHIYRYVIETIEKPVVTVQEELDFVRSYIFLQQMRYGEQLEFWVDLPSFVLTHYLPPLSLQLILENAIKHNLISEEKPLRIFLSLDDHHLVVRNNLQPKMTGARSTRMGQENLKKRYAMISREIPEFRVETKHYQVSLPLIKPENDECTDY